jgi:hypothetical protein
MEFRVSIDEKALFVLLISIAMVSAVGITIAAPPDPGHAWVDIDCTGCIATSNLAGDSVTGDKIADNAVTSDDVNFNYASSDSKGGNATIADSVPWSGIIDIPSDLSDGDDDTQVKCGWSGWLGGISCTGCYVCSPGCLRAYCTDGKVTRIDTSGCCYCQDQCGGE